MQHDGKDRNSSLSSGTFQLCDLSGVISELRALLWEMGLIKMVSASTDTLAHLTWQVLGLYFCCSIQHPSNRDQEALKWITNDPAHFPALKYF